MKHRIRRQRWWTSGFALLGLAICAFLPFGALGAVDTSFTRSVAAPHQRSAGQVQLRVAPQLVAHVAETHLSPPRRVGAPPLLSATASILAAVGQDWAALLILVVVLVLGAPALSLPARPPLLARRPSRGPPRSC